MTYYFINLNQIKANLISGHYLDSFSLKGSGVLCLEKYLESPLSCLVDSYLLLSTICYSSFTSREQVTHISKPQTL